MKPVRTILLIVSEPPKTPFGSSRYFKSHSANFQWGVQPVTTTHWLRRTADCSAAVMAASEPSTSWKRSEEHTSELQSRGHLVCRLLLEKKNVRSNDRT